MYFEKDKQLDTKSIVDEIEKAESVFNQYYESKAQEYKGHEGWRSYGYLRAHLNYLNELAEKLQIHINHPI